ncbi:hypothetical protein NONI108955_44620 [Nocardia ninae]
MKCNGSRQRKPEASSKTHSPLPIRISVSGSSTIWNGWGWCPRRRPGHSSRSRPRSRSRWPSRMGRHRSTSRCPSWRIGSASSCPTRIRRRSAGSSTSRSTARCARPRRSKDSRTRSAATTRNRLVRTPQRMWQAETRDRHWARVSSGIGHPANSRGPTRAGATRTTTSSSTTTISTSPTSVPSGVAGRTRPVSPSRTPMKSASSTKTRWAGSSKRSMRPSTVRPACRTTRRSATARTR